MTVLLEDDFESGSLNAWTYGKDQTPDAIEPEDAFCNVSTGSNRLLRSLDAEGSDAPSDFSKYFHTNTPADFYHTGDKVLQLDVNIDVQQDYIYNTNYRIGLYSVPSGSHVINRMAFMIRFYPAYANNNVKLYTYNDTGTLVDNYSYTTTIGNLQGIHHFALQIDYSESDTTPIVRGYSSGKLLFEQPVSGGFDRDSTHGTNIYIMGQHDAYASAPNGAGMDVDNVKLTSFTPAASTLGKLENGLFPPQRVLGNHVIAADSNGIFGTSTNLTKIQTGYGYWDSLADEPNDEVISKIQETAPAMMRYPGGCLVHNYNWKDTIGPVSQRAHPGDWIFGLDEYLEVCEALGAEPVITVSDYVLPADEMPLHAAQLVEYLNAPATDAYPWALERAANGHAEPYGVKWFELGNESMHGNHMVTPYRQFTAEEYADYAKNCAWAMRSVDPTIQIGIATHPGGGEDYNCQWNRTVVEQAGNASDFLVVHLYAPKFDENVNLPHDEEQYLMQACMAVGEQIEKRLKQYQSMAVAACGKELPLMITEFNAIFIQDWPYKPYRFAYGPALMSSDLVRVFMKDENKVVGAMYWQILNDYFGMLKYENGNFVDERPAFHLFRLWGQHFGSEWVPVEVDSPTAAFAGMRRVAQACGSIYDDPDLVATSSLDALTNTDGDYFNYGYSTDSNGNGSSVAYNSGTGTYSISLNNLDYDSWPMVARQLNDQAYDYEFSCEMRNLTAVVGQPNKDFAFALLLQDSRGWTNTQSSVTLGDSLPGDGWKCFDSKLVTLPDNPGVKVLAELATDSETISGEIEIRNAVMKTYEKEIFPEYALITSSASLSNDGKTLYVIVFNKSGVRIPTTLNIANFNAASAKRWEVSGPSIGLPLGATSGVSEVATAEPVPLSASGGIIHVFPPYSMTAFELYAAQ